MYSEKLPLYVSRRLGTTILFFVSTVFLDKERSCDYALVLSLLTLGPCLLVCLYSRRMLRTNTFGVVLGRCMYTRMYLCVDCVVSSAFDLVKISQSLSSFLRSKSCGSSSQGSFLQTRDKVPCRLPPEELPSVLFLGPPLSACSGPSLYGLLTRWAARQPLP